MLGVVWQQWKLPRIEADVLWGPHGTLPITSKTAAVVTLHDFTSITMAHRHRAKTILSFNLFVARSLELATRVACVSRAVADEAIRGFGVAASKIEVVPNGVDPFFSPGGVEASDYILFTGTLEPRKGLEDLLEVWLSLPEPKPRLVLCGGRGWHVRIPEHPRIEVTGYVSRERLRELYRNALLFVYPSHHEGFGIPPLEAMACGAPVIATRTGAIPDFADGAAELIEPGNVAALRRAMIQLLRDPNRREQLRVAGAERARLWSWDAAAETMTRLVEEAARR